MVGALYLSLDHCHQEGLLESKLNYGSVNTVKHLTNTVCLLLKETCNYHIVTKSLPVLSVQLLVEQRVEKLLPPQ